VDWDDARVLDQICYDLVLGDWPRAQNRTRIAQIANGAPPYSEEEVINNGIVVNVNDLSMTRLLHDARSQYYNGFLKPGNFFTCKTDHGPAHRRSDWGAIVTKEINKPLKRSIRYFEAMRSKFGMLSLHGISPAIWENEYCWETKPLGVEDVLIPSSTLLDFSNLPFFATRRQFTIIELQKATLKAKRDKGWNMEMVDRAIRWLDSQAVQLMGQNWPEVWSPEKVEERIKQDGAFYSSDQAPTLDCFDVYAYIDSDTNPGWIRRIILDSWSTPQLTGVDMSGRPSYKMGRKANGKGARKDGTEFDLYTIDKPDFLFTSGDRKVAKSWENIVSFQFADLSAVAPFRYHSVRSLGFLLYSVCHLQNRLRCKFNEAVFENLMMIMRVKSMDDVQRALNIFLNNRGFIDDTVAFVPKDQRWQPDMAMAELGLNENRGLIQENASSYTQSTNFSKDKTEKTKFQVMAELNSSTQLVSSGLNQAYMYQNVEDRELVRRFMNKEGCRRDMAIQIFRANCLRQGVPEELLVPEVWEVEHERVVGAGNKTMELTINQQLMEWIDRFDPDPQRKIMHDAVLGLTDDASRADALVPEEPVKVTSSVHDAQLATARLMEGLPMAIKTGLNHVQYAETLMADMAMLLLKAKKQGPDVRDIMGLSAMGQHVAEHIKIVAKDKEEKAIVKKLSDQLGKIMNEVKGLFDNLQKQMQKKAQQNGGGQGMDPKDAAKIQAMMMSAKVKAQNQRESHAQRMAQRDLQFKMELQHDQMKQQADIAGKDLEAAGNIKRNRLKSLGDEGA